MRGNPRKVTVKQQQEILRVYKESGKIAAGDLCVSLGVCRRYYSWLASSCGVSLKVYRVLTPAEKARACAVQVSRDHHDRRWKWAIERGAVIA